ncbi:family 16 glycoside hydrolase [Aeoliella mucimassa]|uniref:Trehalose utilization n=1 Tax=Aeoliella mucimassa TaxID=2527972 RepID=A0A518ASQ7_9BACT|nr:family 16 glycoside hydrolase [Aeoliella mucimassa]QDU57754.1 Trehalose utilization [Aeoliella mucimassa]
MRLHRLAWVLFLCLGLTQVAAAEEAKDWKVLFDGTSLDAWCGYNTKGDSAPEGWVIEGDVLTRTAQSPDLMTKEKFENYELKFEWKISEGGNSGLIYGVQVTDQPSYVTGPEYQVLDNKGWNLKATDTTASGSLYGLYGPSEDVAKPAGEWNTGRILVDGNHVEHWLNGKKVVDAEIGSDDWNKRIEGTKFAAWKAFAKQMNGHIALQDHGHQVWFRNMKIRSLGEKKTAEKKGPLRILLVTQSGGFQHSTITRKSTDLSHTEKIMTQLGISTGLFHMDCTKDVENDFKPELIENYDIVMFFTTGKMYDDGSRLPISEETMKWFLDTYIKEQGHGFLGVHSAADTFADYEPYWDMIGGSFNGHPWTANTTVTVKVHDQDHPASEPWGSSFVITDEIYQFNHWQPKKVRVLMSLDMEKTELKKPYHVPVLWVKDYGKGRVMHMSLGHREDVWTNPTYQESLLNGIRWLAGQIDGDATPNPEVDAAENDLAKSAEAEAK